jgi:outer membrane biosynthesis protein TonB
MSAPANIAGAPPPIRVFDRLRWLLIPVFAVAIVLLLVILMRWMIRAPEGNAVAAEQEDGVQMVEVKKDDDKPPDPMSEPDAAPPPPPAAPPSLARSDLPPIAAPSISMTPTPVEIAVGGGPVNLGNSLGLGSSGVFGGFARGGGNGTGAGGSAGTGQGFSGKELIPLSTARPQMPEWACKQKIAGWVEAVFTVQPNGRVSDVKIVDAQPRGVYEAAAIASISNWIYNETKQARQVDQRVPMDPDDCQYNWH